MVTKNSFVGDFQLTYRPSRRLQTPSPGIHEGRQACTASMRRGRAAMKDSASAFVRM
ncbi:hypothetical protein JCM18920_1591 [Cutibacterium acnes JCM 18920]|nr:hypothetical protein JCM18920_1591 [Cutibacterium acnes JCM 18920]